jgi:hypothetical protein
VVAEATHIAGLDKFRFQTAAVRAVTAVMVLLAAAVLALQVAGDPLLADLVLILIAWRRRRPSCDSPAQSPHATQQPCVAPARRERPGAAGRGRPTVAKPATPPTGNGFGNETAIARDIRGSWRKPAAKEDAWWRLKSML